MVGRSRQSVERTTGARVAHATGRCVHTLLLSPLSETVRKLGMGKGEFDSGTKDDRKCSANYNIRSEEKVIC